MKKILFICPYFGKLPFLQTKLWIKTCSYNKSIDWVIITDDKTEFDLPDNVFIKYDTIDNLREKFQSFFDFPISLDNPYKLCDYKPLYGYLFPELVSGYDYWGHCDFSDSIFGNISKFLNEIISDTDEKIGFLGHMTLYKNDRKINSRFLLPSDSSINIKDIFSSKSNFAFDETNDYTINAIYRKHGFNIKRIDSIYSDISVLSTNFKNAIWNDKLKWVKLGKEIYIYEWHNGELFKLYLLKNKLVKKEIGYVHYQKRHINFNIDIENENHFYLIPDQFISYDKINLKKMKKYLKNKIFDMRYFMVKFKNFKKKIKGGK